MNMKKKRDNNSKSNKQTKTNISKKLHKLSKHKNCANTLIKLVRLMEMTGKHT